MRWARRYASPSETVVVVSPVMKGSPAATRVPNARSRMARVRGSARFSARSPPVALQVLTSRSAAAPPVTASARPDQAPHQSLMRARERAAHGKHPTLAAVGVRGAKAHEEHRDVPILGAQMRVPRSRGSWRRVALRAAPRARGMPPAPRRNTGLYRRKVRCAHRHDERVNEGVVELGAQRMAGLPEALPGTPPSPPIGNGAQAVGSQGPEHEGRDPGRGESPTDGGHDPCSEAQKSAIQGATP